MKAIARLTSLEIHHFRNLTQLLFSPHPQFNFFYGDNAQGKTSILEALYFFSEFKSFRLTDSAALIQHQQPSAHLFAQFTQQDLEYDLKIQLSGSQKKILLNDKAPRPYRKVKELLPIILFTPDSTRLFRVNPSERRQYFDQLFSQLSEPYQEAIQDYSKVLKHKQELLEQLAFEGKTPQRVAELEVWNERFIQLAAFITMQRFHLTQNLAQAFQTYFSELSANQWHATLVYQPYDAQLSAGQSEAWYLQHLKNELQRRFQEELTRQQALIGPHRDDWKVLLNQIPLKEEGSQGQHRIAVTALKMAEAAAFIQQDKAPLALFDDLLSELDPERSLQLLKFLKTFQCQVFLTSIQPDLRIVKEFEGESFEVKEGRVFYGHTTFNPK